MKKLVHLFVLPVMLLGSCATIICDKTQVIPISSTPGDAKVLITDEKGLEVFKGATPTSVTLQKSDGTYWGKKSFTVEITKAGYAKQVIPITANANGWYIGGNFVFGGLIGWFIVDPLNGGMYTLSPEQITASLGKGVAQHTNASDGAISIVLVEDVPKDLRLQMTRLN